MTLEELKKKYFREYGKEENRSLRWEKIYKKLANSNHQYLLRAFLKITLKQSKCSKSNEDILGNIITEMTLHDSAEEIKEIVEFAKTDLIIKDFKIKKNNGINVYSFVLSDGSKCNFSQLSDIALNYFYRDKLKTKERFGHCHHYSKILSMQMENENNFVTGKIFVMNHKKSFIHSWIEFSIDNEDYVADTNMNAIMDKKLYYKLRAAQPITKIPSTQVSEDFLRYKDNPIFARYTRLYALYHNEFLKLCDKNLNDEMVK